MQPQKSPAQSIVLDIDGVLATLTVLLERLNQDPSTAFPGGLQQEHDLLALASAVITVTCDGNANKVQERIYTLKQQLDATKHNSGAVYQHITKRYGADILVQRKDGSTLCIEHKASSVKQSTGFKTNWMYAMTVGSHTDAASFNTSILQDVQRKMDNGWIVFDAIQSAKNCKLASYVLNWRFFAAYLMVYYARHNTPVVNLGSKRCSKCKHYHRMLRFERLCACFLHERHQASESTRQILDLTPVGYLANSKWDLLLQRNRSYDPCPTAKPAVKHIVPVKAS